jgi:hypothetical protein
VLNIPPYPKLPDPNGYDLYVQSARSLKTATPPVDEINDRNPPTALKVRTQQYSLARKEAWLKQNKAAFTLFQTALRTPCLHPRMRSDDEINSLLRAYKPLRELAHSIAVEARAQEMRGDWNGAMQSRLDTVQMGTDIRQGGPSIAGTYSVLIQSVGRLELWPIIERMNAPQSRAAIVRLENIYARRLQYGDALQEDKYIGQKVDAQSHARSELRGLHTDASSVSSSLLKKRLWRTDGTPLTTSKSAIMEAYVRHTDAVIANAQRPYKAAKQPVPPLDDPFSSQFLHYFARIEKRYRINDAGNALWLVSLALRAYRLENGAYPAQLKELAPRYLKQVPADPFGGGEALRYRKQGNTYVLYSIGPDAIDNGGRPLAHRKNATASARRQLPPVLPDSTGDYVAGRKSLKCVDTVHRVE